MSGFRAKKMGLNEWTPFQNQFVALFAALSNDKRMALFLRNEPGDDLSTLLIPSFNAEAVEGLSPGGWEDFAAPQQHHWKLLVGNASAAEEFGITLELR